MLRSIDPTLERRPLHAKTFDIIIFNGRPAAGKSEVIDYLKNTPLEERIRRFHVGEFSGENAKVLKPNQLVTVGRTVGIVALIIAMLCAKPLLGNEMVGLPMIDGRQRLTRFEPIFAESIEEVPGLLCDIAGASDVIVTQGAGNVARLAQDLSDMNFAEVARK